MSAPTITATPSTVKAAQEANGAQAAPRTIAVTSLADDPTLAALAAMLVEGSEVPQPEAVKAVSAPSAKFASLIERREKVLAELRVKYGTQDLTALIKCVRVTDQDGLEPRQITDVEKQLLTADVTGENQHHLTWLLNRLQSPLKPARLAKAQTANSKLAELEARRDAEAHRLHMLAGEDASRAPLSQRMMRFREAGRTVQRLLTEEEYQMLVTPVSLETELPRLLFLITVVITSRSAYFGTKGRQVSGTGSVAPKGSIVITRADRRALEPAKVMPVVSLDTNGYGREHVVDSDAVEPAPKRGGAPVVGQGHAQAMQPAGPSARGGMTTGGSRGARTRKNRKK